MTTAEIQLTAVDKTKQAIDGAKRNLEGLGETVNKLPAAFAALGISAAAAFTVSTLKGAIDQADQLNKLSQRTGVATEQLSQLQYAAGLADVSSETLTNSIKKLNVSIADGLAGDKEKIALFKSLGITTADLGKGTQEVLLKMADAYAKADDGPGKVAVGNALMGKSADEMIPFLNAGRKGIVDLMTEADRLGLTIGSGFAKDAEEFNDNLTRLELSGKRLGIALGADVVDGLGKAVKAMADAAIEGGKLRGVIAGIQTLLTGDDRHKNNVAFVEQAEEMLRIEGALAKSRDKDRQYGDKSLATAGFEKQLAEVKARFSLTQNYRNQLTAEEDAAAKAAAPVKKEGSIAKPRSSGGGDSAEKARENFIKGLTKEMETLTMGNAVAKEHEAILLGITGKELELVKTILAEVDAYKVAVIVAKDRAEQRHKESDGIEAFMLAQTEATNAAVKASQDSLAAAVAEFQQYGLSKSQIAELTIATLELTQAKYNDGTEGYKAIQLQIEAQKELVQVLRRGEVRDAAILKADDLKKNTDAVSESISNGLLDGFRDGGSIADIFLRELKAQFAKTVLQPIISPIVMEGNGLVSSFVDGLKNGLTGGTKVNNPSAYVAPEGGDLFGSAISAIKGLFSFDGGGYTGPGNRAGGMDGKGGFLAMMHPNETVLDHSKGQGISRGSTAMTYAPVITVGEGVKSAEVYGIVQGALRENNAAWSEQLKRSGVLAG